MLTERARLHTPLPVLKTLPSSKEEGEKHIWRLAHPWCTVYFFFHFNVLRRQGYILVVQHSFQEIRESDNNNYNIRLLKISKVIIFTIEIFWIQHINSSMLLHNIHIFTYKYVSFEICDVTIVSTCWICHMLNIS